MSQPGCGGGGLRLKNQLYSDLLKGIQGICHFLSTSLRLKTALVLYYKLSKKLKSPYMETVSVCIHTNTIYTR